jgi:two-component system response regulator MprA
MTTGVNVPRGNAPSEAETEGPRVLVIDDDPGIREMLTDALTDEGYAVRAATDGADALGVIGRWRPDVILLDLMMPAMNGWQFAEAYRALPDQHAPLIAITAAGTGAVRSVESNTAIAAVLPKPLDLGKVYETVARNVRRPPA